MPTYSAEAIAAELLENGVKADFAVKGVAVALAESGGKSETRVQTGDRYGSVDRGVWQINDYWHSEVTDQCAHDFACSTKAAVRISAGGANWSQWNVTKPTSNGGPPPYLAHMAVAQAAVSAAAADPGSAGKGQSNIALYEAADRGFENAASHLRSDDKFGQSEAIRPTGVGRALREAAGISGIDDPKWEAWVRRGVEIALTVDPPLIVWKNARLGELWTITEERKNDVLPGIMGGGDDFYKSPATQAAVAIQLNRKHGDWKWHGRGDSTPSPGVRVRAELVVQALKATPLIEAGGSPGIDVSGIPGALAGLITTPLEWLGALVRVVLNPELWRRLGLTLAGVLLFVLGVVIFAKKGVPSE